MSKRPVAAFQGVAGAYSELAAARFFGKGVSTQPYPDFAAVFREVAAKRTVYGVLPVENSLTGSIHQNYDLLLTHHVEIIGEVKLPISHNLLVMRGVKAEALRVVYSHPQALAQCAAFLHRELPHAVATPYFDTAGSARLVAEQNQRDAAAIASTVAGKRYGLHALYSAIEDHKENFTRFIVIRSPGKRPYTEIPAARPKRQPLLYKTSVVFSLKNVPGALNKCLSIFAIRDLDLLKIESRPIVGRPWQYMFYLDFKSPADSEVSLKVLSHLQEITDQTRILGSYLSG